MSEMLRSVNENTARFSPDKTEITDVRGLQAEGTRDALLD